MVDIQLPQKYPKIATDYIVRKPEKNSKSTKDICEPDNGHKSEATKVDLRMKSERLKTFKGWQNEAVTPESLADAGFYYLDRTDVVKCAFCNVEGCLWMPGDNPMKDHASWAPNCPYVQEHTSEPSTSLCEAKDQDVCGNNQVFPHSVPEDETFKLLQKIGAQKSKPCSHEHHSSYESRLKTFEEWPKSLKQKPAKLAEAGFFYKGIGDQTLCFHCGGGLKDWLDNDDPWEQHALWFPKCNFVVLSKGQEYVEHVKHNFKAEVPSNSETKEPAKCEEQALPETKDSSTLCKICYKNEVGIIFIPCGHVVACLDCSLSLKEICPVCRKRFETSLRAFLS